MTDSKGSLTGSDDQTSTSSTTPTRQDSPPPEASHLSTALHPALPVHARDSRSSSPTTNTSTSVPSAAAVQRALSAQRGLGKSLDGVLEGSRDRGPSSSPNSPSWPTSPRLKSPPPSATRSHFMRKTDHEQMPSGAGKRMATISAPEMAAAMLLHESNPKDQQPTAHVRVPARNMTLQNTGLETVDESSVPSTPSLGPKPNARDQVRTNGVTPDSRSETFAEGVASKESEQASNTTPLKPGPGGQPVGQRSRAASTSRPQTSLAKRSFTSLTGPKAKTAETTRTMTVETEPVASTTQIIGDRNREGSSVRTKPSNETIRPRKEKKKSSRKAPSLHAGTITSKADIFEAKVASAVDEADTSDSDETFVYESNPPEPRSNRHHSRTPSATSMASTVDHYGGRSKHGVRSGSIAVAGKKSMKFSNSGYRDFESEGAEGERVRSRNASATPRHHHIGRYGRTGPPSILDNDSPFSQPSKPGSPRASGSSLARPLHTSRPGSPRLGGHRHGSTPRKHASSAYDTYDDAAADDERQPLIGSVRATRSRQGKRPHHPQFRNMDYAEPRENGYCSRAGACLLLGFLIALVCVGVTTFVVALSRPLQDVEIKHLQSVLASEQELMLDLDVKAVNPNLFAISVSDLDVNLFAESPYVGSSDHGAVPPPTVRRSIDERRRRIAAGHWDLPFPLRRAEPEEGVDEGTDPTDDPESGHQKMLLGRIFEFDSPLVFEAAPIRRSVASSVGEIRLAKPGNTTEVGGSVRWERVLQHKFDLIVRGVIKYQLPLSSKVRSAKIASRVVVSPESGGSSRQG